MSEAGHLSGFTHSAMSSHASLFQMENQHNSSSLPIFLFLISVCGLIPKSETSPDGSIDVKILIIGAWE